MFLLSETIALTVRAKPFTPASVTISWVFPDPYKSISMCVFSSFHSTAAVAFTTNKYVRHTPFGPANISKRQVAELEFVILNIGDEIYLGSAIKRKSPGQPQFCF